MKKLLTVLAAAALMTGVASAREVTGTVAKVDPKSGKDLTQTELTYKASATAPKVGVVDYAVKAELAKNARTLGVSAGRKYLVSGVTVTPALELGAGERDVFIKKKKSTVVDERSYGFWGAGVDASVPVVDKVTAEAGLRYRESFTDDVKFDETRVGAGLKYSLTEARTLGVAAWNTSGTVKSKAVGVNFSQKF